MPTLTPPNSSPAGRPPPSPRGPPPILDLLDNIRHLDAILASTNGGLTAVATVVMGRRIG